MPPQQGKSGSNNNMGSHGNSYDDIGDSRRSYNSRRSVRFPDEDDLDNDDDEYPRRGRSSSFYKRMEQNKARKLREQENEERIKYVRTLAIKASMLIVAGVSLCFSTLFVPGMLPFLGGLCCGVSLIEPPMLPGIGPAPTENSPSESSHPKSNSSGTSEQGSVMKQMLMNIINQFF